jgi:hypothetical protein
MAATKGNFQNPYENMKMLQRSYENEQKQHWKPMDADKDSRFYTAPVTPDEYT